MNILLLPDARRQASERRRRRHYRRRDAVEVAARSSSPTSATKTKRSGSTCQLIRMSGKKSGCHRFEKQNKHFWAVSGKALLLWTQWGSLSARWHYWSWMVAWCIMYLQKNYLDEPWWVYFIWDKHPIFLLTFEKASLVWDFNSRNLVMTLLSQSRVSFRSCPDSKFHVRV